MATWYKWNVYCLVHGWKEVLLDSEPTTCPLGDAIDMVQSKVIEKRPANEVIVKEESTPTQGYFKFDDIEVVCPANTTTVKQVSYPHPIGMLNATLVTDTTNAGDTVSWTLFNDTTIGYITADVAITDTVINVSPTAAANIKKGFKVRLVQGATVSDYITVGNYSTINNTITLASAIGVAFLASGPTYVQFTVFYMDNVKLGPAMNIDVGTGKIGASYVPANTIIYCKYINNSNVDKTLMAYVQFLY